MRTQFDYIRCFVPMQAESAATMIALGCDEIVVGNHSELGPIDPQITLMTPEGPRGGPAHAILRDFRRAQEETSSDVSLLAAWTPILRSYVDGLIEYCSQQVNLAIDVVSDWLDRYMLAHGDMGLPDADERNARAEDIANYFGSDEAYDRHRTHERPSGFLSSRRLAFVFAASEATTRLCRTPYSASITRPTPRSRRTEGL